MHNWPNHIYCILELPLYCLFQSLIALPSMMGDVIFSAHIRGALPRFVSWVQSQIEDAKLAMEFIKCTEDDIITIDDYEEELFCHQCEFPIVNIFVTSEVSDNESTLCINCIFNSNHIDNRKKKSSNFKKISGEEYHLKCRFASPTALKYLLTNVNKLVGEKG